MVQLLRLVKNGNSTHVVIPRGFLRSLAWNTGEQVAVELLEDGTLCVRQATVRDLRASGHRPMVAARVMVGAK
jgi:antitoxin component of MazEF toxin-antitoxin module